MSILASPSDFFVRTAVPASLFTFANGRATTSAKRVAWATPESLQALFSDSLTSFIWTMKYEIIIQYYCHLVVYALLGTHNQSANKFQKLSDLKNWNSATLPFMIRDTCCRARQLRGTTRSRIERLQIFYLQVCIAVRRCEQPIEPFNYCSKLLQIQFNRRLVLKLGSMDIAHWGLLERLGSYQFVYRPRALKDCLIFYQCYNNA